MDDIVQKIYKVYHDKDEEKKVYQAYNLSRLLVCVFVYVCMFVCLFVCLFLLVVIGVVK